MTNTPSKTNEEAAATAFDKQAPLFDKIYEGDLIIQYKRKRVRDHFLEYLQHPSSILELNGGTGEDALFFASRGHKVHVTDISPAMQSVLKEKIAKNPSVEERLTYELRSFTDLVNLSNRGPFDAIFSNFAGLNCTNELSKVLYSFEALLKPGGIVTLVVLPKFCLWEFLLLFRGKFKTAFRRFSGSAGSKARVEGQYFRCWYYNPSYIRRQLASSFEVLAVEGLCTLVPPSYIENFGERHAKAFNYLQRKEEKWKDKWPWRSIGDYYIISLRKKS